MSILTVDLLKVSLQNVFMTVNNQKCSAFAELYEKPEVS